MAPEIHDDADPLPEPPLPWLEDQKGTLLLNETAAAAPTARPSVKANIHFSSPRNTKTSKFNPFTFPIGSSRKP